MIKISCTAREGKLKGDVRRLRREGFIPVVIYSKGQTPYIGAVSKEEFTKELRTLPAGFLTTTRFILKDSNGHERNAIVKEIQYKATTYDVLHIDFLELEKGRPIYVQVPVEFQHATESIGVKLGGQLRHITRHVRIRCLPDDIPECFLLDVKDLGIRQIKRIRDITIPKTVTCMAHADDVIAAVIK